MENPISTRAVRTPLPATVGGGSAGDALTVRSGDYSAMVLPCDGEDLILWIHDGRPRIPDIESVFAKVAAQPYFHPEVNCIDIWVPGFDPSCLDGAAVTAIGRMTDHILGRRLAKRPPRYAVLAVGGTSMIFGKLYKTFMRDVARCSLPVDVSWSVEDVAAWMAGDPQRTASRVAGALERYYGRPFPGGAEALLAAGD